MLPQRKSPRLQGYDYAQTGAYFVTICTQDRMPYFGGITAGIMTFFDAGQMLIKWWEQLPHKYTTLELDYWVVMPNHFHGIVVLMEENPAITLSQALGWFKAMTTNAYIQGVKSQGWKPFKGKLWQRSFHDHIIRNETALNSIREYILTNPDGWEKDTFYHAM